MIDELETSSFKVLDLPNVGKAMVSAERRR